MSTSQQSSNSTPTNSDTSDSELLPCVQYGFPSDEGPHRTPKLFRISEPIPDRAITASPVYVVTQDQLARQERLDTGYEVTGEVASIATELQNECEADDRVLYPIHVESDAYLEEGPATLIRWCREFVEDRLGIPFHSCRLYFSGNRSIHVHVPRFVSGEDQRERLREEAETFCDETGADLDCGLYYAKRLFRLPGVEHEQSGLPKVEIQPEWGHNEIIRTASAIEPSVPPTYADVLQNVFTSQEELTSQSVDESFDDPHALFRVLDSDKTVLEFSSNERNIETPLIEQEHYPEDPADAITWLQYNAKEFSPYAKASGNERSVAVVEVKDGAFARDDVRNGAALIPAYFYGARGCVGEEFTKKDEHAPLQLSTRDYERWDYDEGDIVVVIGGRSRKSRIFEVKSLQATVTGQALTGEDGSRRAALDYLEDEGYDVGAAGHTTTTMDPDTTIQSQPSDVKSGGAPQTEAATLQRKAEKEGIGTLTHMERFRVGCRLLKINGWDGAWDWFREQFGADFDPDITRRQLQSILHAYPTDYGHVEPPS